MPSARILVVEDNATLRQLVLRQLHAEGFTAVAVHSAETALTRLAEGPASGGFDLLVADVRLPEASGSELATVVAQQYPKLQVVFITGSEASVAHMVDPRVVVKPFTRDELLAGVRGALGIVTHKSETA